MNRYHKLQLMMWGNAVVIALLALGLLGAALVAYQSSGALQKRFKLGEQLARIGFRHLFIDYRQLDLPIYDVHVSPANWQSLLDSLPPARSLLLEHYKKSVPARFIANGQEHKVKLRVRGLANNHWIDRKKSWRIRFKRSAPFQGRRNMNLIIPQDRGYLAEHLSNHIAQKLGLLVPESRFALLRMNDRFEGVYFEVEQPSREMLARHRRPDEANFYNEDDWDWKLYDFTPIFTDVGHWRKAASAEFSGAENYAELDRLLWLIGDAPDATFRRQIGDLIDLESFYRWQSHSVIMGSRHQSEHGNMYLYFSPVDGRFRFMPWDVGQELIQEPVVDQPYNPLVSRMLAEPDFRHARNQTLWTYVSDDAQFEEDVAFYDKTDQQMRRAFYADRIKGFMNLRYDREVNRHRTVFRRNHRKILENLRWCHVFATMRPGRTDDEPTEVQLSVHGFSTAALHRVQLTFADEVLDQRRSEWSLWRDVNASGAMDDGDERVAVFTQVDQGGTLETLRFEQLLFEGRDDAMQPVLRHHRFFILAPEGAPPPQHIEMQLMNAITNQPIAPTYRTVDQQLDAAAQSTPASAMSPSGIPAGVSAGWSR